MPARAELQALGLQQLRPVTQLLSGLNKEGRTW